MSKREIKEDLSKIKKNIMHKKSQKKFFFPYLSLYIRFISYITWCVKVLLPVNSGERLRHVAVEHRSCRERESGRTQLHHSSVAQRVSGRQWQWNRWSAQLGGLHLMADICLELSAFYIRAPSSPGQLDHRHFLF